MQHNDYDWPASAEEAIAISKGMRRTSVFANYKLWLICKQFDFTIRSWDRGLVRGNAFQIHYTNWSEFQVIRSTAYPS